MITADPNFCCFCGSSYEENGLIHEHSDEEVYKGKGLLEISFDPCQRETLQQTNTWHYFNG